MSLFGTKLMLAWTLGHLGLWSHADCHKSEPQCSITLRWFGLYKTISSTYSTTLALQSVARESYATLPPPYYIMPL